MPIQFANPLERLAYGRIEDPENDPILLRLAARPGTALIGRLLLASIFVISGIAKVTDPAGAIAYMQAAGIPAAEALVWVAGFAEILGGASLIFGAFARLGGFALSIYLIPVTILFHDFWNLDGPERMSQMADFMKNLAILGGLSLVVAYGAGRYSADYLMRRRRQP